MDALLVRLCVFHVNIIEMVNHYYVNTLKIKYFCTFTL